MDYAVDVLAPDLVLDPECFVMHSQSNRADHIEDVTDVQVNGRSGRVTSVTIGKMPGRQVIVYDKRAEVIAKRKDAWWEIWNAGREAAGRKPLDRADSASSRVWRIELRAGKKHLYDRWRLRTWADLDMRLGDLYAATLEAVRHCEPTGDTNRARWPVSEAWETVALQVEGERIELRCHIDPDTVKAVNRDVHDRITAKSLLLHDSAGVKLMRRSSCQLGYRKQESKHTIAAASVVGVFRAGTR